MNIRYDADHTTGVTDRETVTNTVFTDGQYWYNDNQNKNVEKVYLKIVVGKRQMVKNEIDYFFTFVLPIVLLTPFRVIIFIWKGVIGND